ncbi:MAG: DsbA family protein [Anaerolineae bacterium]
MAKAKRRRTSRTIEPRSSLRPILIFIGLPLLVVAAIIVLSTFLNRPDTSVEVASISYPTGVTAEGEPFKGGENAAVVIEEFADFECPHCGTFHNTLKTIEEDFVQTGQVRIVFRNYPFLRQTSVTAAQGSECALQQNPEAFWAFHDALFENQGRGANTFAPNNLKRIAAQVGLDTNAFDTCMDRGLTTDEVQADFAEGQQRGVNSTPTLFINGQLVRGGLDEAQLRDVISQLLAAAE